MSKIQQTQSRTAEIADRLLAGATSGELEKEYSEKWVCSERTVRRLIAFAKDKIFGNLNNKESILDSLRTEAIMDDLGDSMLTTMELEAKLSGIASGTTMMDRLVSGKEGTEI